MTSEAHDKHDRDEALDRQNITESMLLFQRYREGDREALNQLFERSYPMVRRVVRIRTSARLGRWHAEDDLVQEAICRALESLSKFQMRGPGSFRAWLRRLTENAVAAVARGEGALKRGRDRLISDIDVSPDSGSAGLVRGAPGQGPSPSLNMKQEEYQNLADACLARLPEREREVLILRRYFEHPWAEVAEILGCPSLGAAQQLAQRAKVHLNELLQQHRDDLPSGLGSR